MQASLPTISLLNSAKVQLLNAHVVGGSKDFDKVMYHSPPDKKNYHFLLARSPLFFIIISSFIYPRIEQRVNYTYRYAVHLTGLLFQISSIYTKMSDFRDTNEGTTPYEYLGKSSFVLAETLGNF